MVLLLWRIGAKTEVPLRTRTPYFFLFALGVVLLMVGSWAGGVLVFEHEVGVSKQTDYTTLKTLVLVS